MGKVQVKSACDNGAMVFINEKLVHDDFWDNHDPNPMWNNVIELNATDILVNGNQIPDTR
mgnify:CR=1 FL=1